MKENKEKEVVGEEVVLRLKPRFVRRLGIKGNVCLKTYTLETSLADEVKKLSMCRPKKLGPTFLHLSRPSKYMT